MLTIHDATPMTADGLSVRPVLDALAREIGTTADRLTVGEEGRTTTYCIDARLRYLCDRPADQHLLRLRAAQAAGLTLALSVFPAGVDFATGDADGLFAVNEDGTRGAVIRRPFLHPGNHREDYEATVGGIAFRDGGGVPDVD